MGRLFLEMNENIWMGAANYEHRFLFKDKTGVIKKFQPTLKVGTYLENKSREFSIRNIGYAPSSIFTFDWNLANLPIDSLFIEENINSTTGMKLDEDTKGADSYKAENKLRSYYAMVRLPFTKRWNLSAGLRIEDNTQILRSNEITGDTVNVEYHIVRGLPSGNLSYHIIEDTLLLRAGYGKTLNRPEFRELAPLSFYDFVFNAIYTGNPELETPSIDNMDFRAEWYPNAGEMISAGFFYKKFFNPIEIYFVPGVGSGGTRSFTYDTFLSRFSLVANASFIKSKVELSEADAQTGVDATRPMMGQSPYIINAGIYYEDPKSGWSINLLYNRIGERIVIVGIPGIPEVYEMPRNLLDLTISKNIGKYASIRLSANDIFNNKFVLLQDANNDDKLDIDTDQVMQFYRRGSYFTAGFTFRI
jgi:outer membrane receptor protein involved in Fe transport